MPLCINLLKTHVVESLENDEEPLSKRIHFAYCVFKTDSIKTPRKHHVIFQWAAQLIKNSNDTETLLQAFGLLAKCLSNAVTEHGLQIAPQIVDSILEVLATIHQLEGEVFVTALDCLVELLAVPFFLQRFKRDGDALAGVIEASMLASSRNGDAELCAHVISKLMFVLRESALKRQLRVRFADRMLLDIVSALVAIQPGGEKTPLRNKAESCISEALFYDAKSCSWLSSCLVGSEPEDINIPLELKALVDRFADSSRELPHKAMPTCFALILDACTKCQTSVTDGKNNLVFELFVRLTNFIGLSPTGEQTRLMKHLTKNDAFAILQPMLNVLNSLNCSLNSTTSNWLVLLTSKLFHYADQDMSAGLLSALTEVMPLHPITQTLFKEFVQHIVIVKKDSAAVQSSYATLISALLKASSRIHRVPVFLTQLLSHLKEEFNSKDCIDLSACDILPKKFIAEFCKAVTVLTSTTSITILKILTTQLEEEVVPMLQYHGEGYMTQAEIALMLLSSFLRSTRIADSTLPDVSKNEYINMVVHKLPLILADLGKAILKMQLETLLLVAYLELCHAWGQLRLLLVHYLDEKLTVQRKRMGGTPSDLAYLHSYLPKSVWADICKIVSASEDIYLKNLWWELMIQKIETLLSCEQSGLSSVHRAIEFLCSEAECDWLCRQLALIAPHLDSTHCLALTNQLVNHLATSESDIDIDSLDLPRLQETRAVISFSLSILLELDRTLLVKNCLSVDQMVHSLDANKLFYCDPYKKKDNVLMSTNLNAIGALLMQAISSQPLPSKEEIIPVERCVHLLSHLPLNHFPAELQTGVLFIILAVIQNYPKTDQTAFPIVLDLMPNIHIPPSLNTGQLFLWLNKRFTVTDLRIPVLQSLCEVAFAHPDSVKSIYNVVKHPKLDSLDLTVTFLKTKFGSHSQKKKKQCCLLRKQESRLYNRLLKLIVCSGENVTPSLLDAFSVTLRFCLAQQLRRHIDCLMPLLPVYVDCALASCQAPQSARLLYTLFTITPRLEALPADFITRSWCTVAGAPNGLLHLLRSLALNSTVTEYEKFINSLSQQLTEQLANGAYQESHVERMCKVWKVLIEVSPSCSNAKSLKLGCALGSFGESIICLAFHWRALQTPPPSISIKEVLSLLTTMFKTKKVTLSWLLLDSALELMGSLTLPKDDHLYQIAAIAHSLEMLIALTVTRPELLADRISPFMQRYHWLVTACAGLSHAYDASCHEPLISAAYQLSKLTKALVAMKHDFSGIAPYEVEFIIFEFQKNTIYPQMKVFYLGIAQSWLSLCNDHAIGFLKRKLPFGALELFSKLLRDYTQHYQYKGKV